MSIAIADYMFKGPLMYVNDLKDLTGIYAIICIRNNGIYIIDVGESPTVRTTIRNHPKKERWVEKCQGVIAFAVYYMPECHQPGKRIVIEHAIRRKYNIAQGEY